MLRHALFVVALGFASLTWADTRTVTLSVPGMYCEMCPATVKKALSRVPGVSDVKASFEEKQAVVTFDDTKASVDTLMQATANAGYPSTVKR